MALSYFPVFLFISLLLYSAFGNKQSFWIRKGKFFFSLPSLLCYILLLKSAFLLSLYSIFYEIIKFTCLVFLYFVSLVTLTTSGLCSVTCVPLCRESQSFRQVHGCWFLSWSGRSWIWLLLRVSGLFSAILGGDLEVWIIYIYCYVSSAIHNMFNTNKFPRPAGVLNG